MISKTKAFLKKHREIILYAIVGGMTTAVSWITAYILKLFLKDQIFWQNVMINSLSWTAAKAFSYPANRVWVFKSNNPNIIRECFEFISSRVMTGLLLDVGLMAVLVNLMHVNFWVSKLVVSVLVIIGNYVLSKLVVFK